jgi:hypothetical protein
MKLQKKDKIGQPNEKNKINVSSTNQWNELFTNKVYHNKKNRIILFEDTAK